MRSDLTDETPGQDALHELVLDAMRRTDAASTASATDAHADSFPSLATATGSARSLRWSSTEEASANPLEVLGRRLTDLATVAAAVHRGRSLVTLLASGSAAASPRWEVAR